MALYSAMFSQYGVNTAQVLVTKADFYNEFTRQNLTSTLNELLELNIVPILNTNDAIAAPPEKNVDLKGVISIKDNDSLAARVADLIQSDLLLIMSDVDGLYNMPPTETGSRLLAAFNPRADATSVAFGDKKSKVGTGGMSSKVQAATWALEKNCSVVICNGQRENAITEIIKGKNIGTFFSFQQPDARF
jgi:delta-1-pyrroline-5-carboxylate synthetase